MFDAFSIFAKSCSKELKRNKKRNKAMSNGRELRAIPYPRTRYVYGICNCVKDCFYYVVVRLVELSVSGGERCECHLLQSVARTLLARERCSRDHECVYCIEN